MLDENEIRQLVLNLVRNGLEAMPSGWNHEYTDISEENKCLAIKDSGNGKKREV
jgi:signal transduction histidine kinase